MHLAFRFLLASLLLLLLLPAAAQQPDFQHNLQTGPKPWTGKAFFDDPDWFQFAIVTDRTGGHRDGIFEKAVAQLNMLVPEFVMSVGDLIEGSDRQDSLDSQWAEFTRILDPLEMNFFYVPGNHDIANGLMRKEWMKRYGRSYYFFIYKQVLFLVMDTNDTDDFTGFSDEQIAYIKSAIADHPEVRWTLLFMHHPAWYYRELNRFAEIEAALKDRPYTVFAGHEHHYQHAVRQDRNYYVLATTGGGSALRGPMFGEFDHVSWVTMTAEGPRMINLKLDGMISPEVVTEANAAKSQALIQAARFHGLMTYTPDQRAGKLFFAITNTSDDTLHFEGRVYHNHHLILSGSKLPMTLPPRSTVQQVLEWTLDGQRPFARIDPVEIDFRIGYRSGPGEPEFSLEGVYAVPRILNEAVLRAPDDRIFLDQQQVTLATPFQQLDIRYTLDGSVPSAASERYTGPLTLTGTSVLRAACFDPLTGQGTEYLEFPFRKVAPYAPVKPRREAPGLAYRYFEGEFPDLPAFGTLTPVRSGAVSGFDVGSLAGSRSDHYAIEYTGYLEVPSDGLYTFYLHSDDGARLYLHDELVVDNGGSHSARTRTGQTALLKGKHPVRIEYFEDYMGQELQLHYLAPGEQERRRADPAQFTHSR